LRQEIVEGKKLKESCIFSPWSAYANAGNNHRLTGWFYRHIFIWAI